MAWRVWVGMLAMAVVGCAGEPPAAREVEVTRLVAVTQEVTREVAVQQTVVVTREVPVEVTVIVAATAEPTQAATTVAVSDTLPVTATVPSLATTIAITEPGSGGAAACWTWQEAAQHIGEAGCVEATVTGVGGSESAFFINFSEERGTFYLVAFDWAWEELEGECLRVQGTVTEFRGRPQMIVNDPTQLFYCGTTDSPPAFPR